MMKNYIIKGTGFTLIELLIVVAIIAILAGTVIMILNPGERMFDAREAARESHMITIGEAIHLAVVDCTEDTATYCSNVAAVVDYCQTDAAGDDFTLDADKADCQLDDELDPSDPLVTGGEFSEDAYIIEHDGDHNVEVWSPSAESTWFCDPDGEGVCGGTSKRF